MNSRKKILIVDDSTSIRKVLEMILEKDYDIRSAQNGQIALETMDDFLPGLVLLDVDMPVLNGLETCRKIRENKKFRFTKIIFLSSRSETADRLAGYEEGADDYLIKPFNGAELLAKIRIMFRLRNEEELNQIKTDILTLISHETRTPLNTILGFARLLQNKLPDEYKSKAEMILKSGLRLFEFLQKATLLCELKAKLQLSTNKGSLLNCINNEIEKLQPEIKEKAINLVMLQTNDYKIMADWTLLEKAFNYVLENAVKFSPENGQIKVTLSKNDQKIHVISVYDQGEGIPEEWLDMIFDEFAIHDINHHQKGQGLSLAIARHILQAHGGTLTGGNNAEGGAFFTFKIP